MEDTSKAEESAPGLVLVARRACFGLPTGCPACLPVYLYLKLANASFELQYDRKYPDSDTIPYAELGDYVAYNNEKGGVIERLKEDRIVDLDSRLSNDSLPDWTAAKAMVSTWLADAVTYELWLTSEGDIADEIYFSDLPWPIKKSLHWKQSRAAKHLLGITQIDISEAEKEIHRRARIAYEALSLRLGGQTFFFDNRPTSLDAAFLGHALFVLHALPDSSTLRNLLVNHSNLVMCAENLKREFLEASSSSSPSPSLSNPSFDSASTSKGGTSSRWRSKPKPKPKREKTEEEKTFRRRTKYFLAAQLIAVLVFFTVMGGSSNNDVDMEDDGDQDESGYDY